MPTTLLPAPKPLRHPLPLSIVIGCALVVSGIVNSPGTGSVNAQTPDPCALLTADDIQPLAGNQELGKGVGSATQSLGRAACRYQWGVGTGRYTLDVIVDEASKMYSNMTPDAIKQTLAAPGGVGAVGEAIPDVGEAATFKSDSHLLATASAFMKGRVLQLNLDGIDARAKKDLLIALLKAGTSRL